MSNEKVLFDPGFSQYLVNFSSNIEEYKATIASLVSFSQRKSIYASINRKIHVLIKNNTAFYLGCLLWAYYITKTYKESPGLISGNSFYGLPEAKLKEYDCTKEINFLLNYFSEYEKDCKYYGIKMQPISDDWIRILKLYKEFLELNSCFINTKYTENIIIPEEFARLNFDFDLSEEIKKSIQEKRIENLLELKIFP